MSNFVPNKVLRIRMEHLMWPPCGPSRGVLHRMLFECSRDNAMLTVVFSHSCGSVATKKGVGGPCTSCRGVPPSCLGQAGVDFLSCFRWLLSEEEVKQLSKLQESVLKRTMQKDPKKAKAAKSKAKAKAKAAAASSSSRPGDDDDVGGGDCGPFLCDRLQEP